MAKIKKSDGALDAEILWYERLLKILFWTISLAVLSGVHLLIASIF